MRVFISVFILVCSSVSFATDELDNYEKQWPERYQKAITAALFEHPKLGPPGLIARYLEMKRGSETSDPDGIDKSTKNIVLDIAEILTITRTHGQELRDVPIPHFSALTDSLLSLLDEPKTEYGLALHAADTLGERPDLIIRDRPDVISRMVNFHNNLEDTAYARRGPASQFFGKVDDAADSETLSKILTLIAVQDLEKLAPLSDIKIKQAALLKQKCDALDLEFRAVDLKVEELNKKIADIQRFYAGLRSAEEIRIRKRYRSIEEEELERIISKKTEPISKREYAELNPIWFELRDLRQSCLRAPPDFEDGPFFFTREKKVESEMALIRNTPEYRDLEIRYKKGTALINENNALIDSLTTEGIKREKPQLSAQAKNSLAKRYFALAAETSHHWTTADELLELIRRLVTLKPTSSLTAYFNETPYLSYMKKLKSDLEAEKSRTLDQEHLLALARQEVLRLESEIASETDVTFAKCITEFSVECIRNLTNFVLSAPRKACDFEDR